VKECEASSQAQEAPASLLGMLHTDKYQKYQSSGKISLETHSKNAITFFLWESHNCVCVIFLNGRECS
jgi:hypothetical protein